MREWAAPRANHNALDDRQRLDRHILPIFGDKPVAAITLPAVIKWLDAMRAAVGKDHTILRVHYALCSRVLFDRMTPPEATATWRAKGSTRIECSDGEESLSMDLR